MFKEETLSLLEATFLTQESGDLWLLVLRRTLVGPPSLPFRPPC